MKRNFVLLVAACITIFGLSACQKGIINPTAEKEIANPASVYCEEHNGKLEMRQDAAGGVAGICVFSDGSECDEWAYLRGTCRPGDSLAGALITPTESQNAPVDWKLFENKDLGYVFSYPGNATITINDEPRKGISITGPVINNESWPAIGFNNPGEGQEYAPPAGTDLQKWLVDHYLSADKVVGEYQVAGVDAVHTRHDRSPQSYAADAFYFVKNGKIFSVVFLHTGDKEDWDLYNHFLESIKFD